MEVGSTNIRIAKTDDFIHLTTVSIEDGKSYIPSACALKANTTFSEHIPLAAAEDVRILIGDSAISYLKRRNETGSDYIPASAGRSDVRNPNNADLVELLSLLFVKIFSQDKFADMEDITVIYPSYYTFSQRATIVSAITMTRVPLRGTIDDDHAILQYFSVKHPSKFAHKKKHILFVDVGGGSVRAFRSRCFINRTLPFVRTDAYEWTEQSGGNAFAKRIAQHHKVSMRKAEKMLIKAPAEYIGLLKPEIEALEECVRKVMGPKVSEVQVFGGASRFSFVHDAIQRVVGAVPVRHDLPVTETALYGGLYYSLAKFDLGPFPLIETHNVPIYTQKLECNGVSVDYCERGKSCTDYLMLPNALCNQFRVFAPKEQVPRGASTELSRYDLTNISDFLFDPDDALIGCAIMDTPQPIVIASMWCVQGENDSCENINVEAGLMVVPGANEMHKFVKAVFRGESNRKRSSRLMGKLANAIAKAETDILRDQINVPLKNAITDAKDYLESEQQPSTKKVNALLARLGDEL